MKDAAQTAGHSGQRVRVGTHDKKTRADWAGSKKTVWQHYTQHGADTESETKMRWTASGVPLAACGSDTVVGRSSS